MGRGAGGGGTWSADTSRRGDTLQRPSLQGIRKQRTVTGGLTLVAQWRAIGTRTSQVWRFKLAAIQSSARVRVATDGGMDARERPQTSLS